MTRVLLVAAATSTTGGGERHVADLVRRLPSRGIDLALACPEGGDLPDLARSLGVPVHPAPIASGLSIAGLRGLRRAIGIVQPDIVHAHGSRAAFFARVADPQAAARVVYTVHGIHVDRAGSPARRVVFTTLERALSYRTRSFVCVCAADARKGAELGILDASRARVIHNGIDLPVLPVAATGAFRREIGVDDDTPLALSVGRFHEQKDHATLLSAWAVVRARVPDAVLALIGSGPLEADLREHAAALGLGESVRFCPPRPDLASAYADADLFVLSSLWEGLPYVILEAMGHGLPVVSTAVDGIPEAVLDERTGLLVPPRDPAALAEAIVRVLADPERARMMGEAGRERIARCFTLDAMVDSLVALYGEVTGDA